MAGESVKPKVFNCPGCGASLEISALGYTSTIVCKSCKSILDANHPLYAIIGVFNLSQNYKPLFDLGSFGTLAGTKWKIIGFVVREDKGSSFQWEEYLLYNPYRGFRWLLRIDGHFSITSRLKTIPEFKGESNGDKKISVAGRDYDLFNKGKARVVYVVGEFYWRVQAGETVSMSDYISPPYMVSVEVDKYESNWSISEYLSQKEVNSAFKANKFVLGPSSVAANQPNPYGNSQGVVKQMAGAVAVLCLVALISAVAHPDKVVVTENVVKALTPAPALVPPDLTMLDANGNQVPVASAAATPAAPATFVSKSFEIPDSNGNLEIDMFSSVHNQWVEAGVTLVDEKTGEDFSFNHGVEYYSGSDSDGAWSEGSQSDSKLISSVPGGTYHMEVELAGDMPEPSTQIVLKRHGTMFFNFIFALALLMGPGIWVFFRHRSFETSRWSESDFNPFPESTLLQNIGEDDDE